MELVGIGVFRLDDQIGTVALFLLCPNLGNGIRPLLLPGYFRDAVQDYETGNQKLAASLDQLQK